MGKETSGEHKDTWLVRHLKAWDRKLLETLLPKPKTVLIAAAVLFVAAVSLVPFMGKDFLPEFNEGTAMISIVAVPGISLAESNKLGRQAETILLSVPEVKSISRRTGRAEMDEHAMGVNTSEIDVDFHTTGRPKDVVLEEIRTKLKDSIPGVGVNVGQPISHLIDHMLSGVNAAIAIKIFGQELDVLNTTGIDLKEAIEDVPGLVDLRIEQQGQIPQIKVYVLRDEAAKYGLSPGEVTKLLDGF